MFKKLALFTVCIFLLPTLCQGQTPSTRIVLSYTGPRGSYPTVVGPNRGLNWPAITHITFARSPQVDYLWPLTNNKGTYHEFFVTRTVTDIWLCDPDAKGSIYTLDQIGEPDYIILRIGRVDLTTNLREVRVTRFKNDVRMGIPTLYQLPHVLNVNIKTVY